MKVRCRMCSHFRSGYCYAKKSASKHPKVRANKPRACALFSLDADMVVKEAEKEAARKAMPVCIPTWRYYASKDELRQCNEQDSPKFIRIEDARLKNIFVGGGDVKDNR